MTVYKNFINFYKPELDKRELKALCRRNDAVGFVYFSTWLATCVLSGAWVVASLNTPWVLIAMIVHGALLSFSYAASHECAHGTAFKTRWLNEAVFWFTSLVFGEEPVYRRYSHTSHHSYTWLEGMDAQMPYKNPITLKQYVKDTIGLSFFREAIRPLVAHSLGRVSEDVKAFVPASEIPKMRRNSLLFLLVYGSLLLSVPILGTVLPLVLYFIPRVIGGWVVNLYIHTQHMCMQENIPDHRYTTRSIRCNMISRWLYWNMNYHIEHHLFPSVPFYSLPDLNQKIAPELPIPSNGVLGANREILKVIDRQRNNPDTAVVPQF